MLSNGADVNAANSDGETALIFAASSAYTAAILGPKDHVKMVRNLIIKGMYVILMPILDYFPVYIVHHRFVQSQLHIKNIPGRHLAYSAIANYSLISWVPKIGKKQKKIQWNQKS